ncbi:assembly/transport component in curli production [Salmonella enterica subsp. enterica]|uniref:Assembly/transport component in curli production n=1 Tax=Salmonella enterica I TaxID=59201 RepID=A0A379WVQ2_SALET|nr:assembly/transport component in curli production [Salmonella enterica subsp. enterica]
MAMNNRIPLQSLTAANIMVEGSIIGYESNVKSGGSAQDISVLAPIRSISWIRLLSTCAWLTSVRARSFLR